LAGHRNKYDSRRCPRRRTPAGSSSNSPATRFGNWSDRKEEDVARKRKRKYSPGAGEEVKSEMHRYKRGKAKSGRGGKGGKVKSRKQAIAIGLSKARKKGKKVPKKRS
jgi:hypothetical protein